MTKSTARIISLVAWMLSAVFVVAGLYLFYKLSADVDRLKRERDSMTVQFDDMRRDRDNLSSSSILLKNSIVAYRGYVAKTSRILNGNCSDAWRTRCRRYLRYGDLLSYHSVTLVSRITVNDTGGYRQLLKRYQATFPLIDRVNWFDPAEGGQWTAIANEGKAYAYWKLGRPDLARAPIEAALRSMGGSSIVVATDLKVKCALHFPADRIRRQFDTFRSSFGRRIRSLERDGALEQQESAAYNLDLFSADTELRRVCAYARLT